LRDVPQELSKAGLAAQIADNESIPATHGRARQVMEAKSKLRETGWLIERKGPTWASVQLEPYVAFKWTYDSTKAIRYARREDAEMTKALMQDPHSLKVTEHVWIGAALAAHEESPPATPKAVIGICGLRGSSDDRIPE
jgi:hypothetical protein